MEIIFDNPQYLFFLLSLPVLIILHYVMLKRVRGRLLQFANFIAMARIASVQTQPRNLTQLIVRLLTLALIILAVSGMHFNYLGKGVDSDYVLAVDISSSMSTKDILPSRIEVAKEAAVEFINLVPEKTEIGFVAFSGTSFVEQLMTDNKNEVISKIRNTQISYIGGTDIGEAIISSSNLLIERKNGKAIILITDGMSNIGVEALKAVEYANNNNIQVFTIGIGTKEGGVPESANISIRMDEELLQRIAEITNAKYIYARSKDEIVSAYGSILNETDRKISINLTVGLMFCALALSFIDWMLVNTKYKRIP